MSEQFSEADETLFLRITANTNSEHILCCLRKTSSVWILSAVENILQNTHPKYCWC